jgi:hypothetical protein
MMREKLIELLKSKSCWNNDCPEGGCEKCDCIAVMNGDAEHIADYLIAKGVVVQFPKVGKKIYIHQFDNNMKKVVVECKIINQNNAKELFKVKLADGRRLTLLYQFVGKTVFLNREDAERALKESAK